VSETGGNDDKSFSWSLKSDGFALNSNDAPVFICDKGGITVNGNVTAAEGEIGALRIVDGGLALGGGSFIVPSFKETVRYVISTYGTDDDKNGLKDFDITKWNNNDAP
jgi:hypothetical protein